MDDNINKDPDYCCKCNYWHTSKFIIDTYGEGLGKCTLSKDIIFCTKTPCMMYDRLDNLKEDKEK